MLSSFVEVFLDRPVLVICNYLHCSNKLFLLHTCFSLDIYISFFFFFSSNHSISRRIILGLLTKYLFSGFNRVNENFLVVGSNWKMHHDAPFWEQLFSLCPVNIVCQVLSFFVIIVCTKKCTRAHML